MSEHAGANTTPTSRSGRRKRTAIVTGAAGGIGSATVARLLRAGFRVGAFDVDASGLERLRTEVPNADQLITGILDVTDESQWREALSAVVGEHGKLDVLINNAGILAAGAFEEIDFARQRRTLEINATGTMLGCFTCHDALAAAGGTVINLCSASAIYGQADLASYSASKFAVRGLTEALDLEWAPRGIAVRAVWPLYVGTGLLNGVDIASTRGLGVKLVPDDVARTIIGIVRRPQRGGVHHSVGFQATWMRALAQVSPDAFLRLINRRVGGR